MSQYYPTAKVMDHSFLYRELYKKEYQKVLDEMEKLGLEYGWVQSIESTANYRPDFDREHPFDQFNDNSSA